jgi:serine phosphatase RsbU (regulator of sigma subunit)
MKKLGNISIFLPFALFIGSVFVDLNVLSSILEYATVKYFREGLITLALILLLPIIYKQRWASDRNVVRGLRSLFYLILGTFLLLLFSDLEPFAAESISTGHNVLYASMVNYAILTAWAVFSTLFVLVILGTLRNLIFIKQKKNTALHFLLLMLLLVIYSVLSVSTIGDLTFRFSYRLSSEDIGYFLLFIVINLMVLNAFRVTWLNYLNRKQKLTLFWGGMILVPTQWLLYIKYHNSNPAALFSPVLGRFVDLGFLFLSIYISVAFIALVFHLPTAHLFDRQLKRLSSLHLLSRAISSEFDLNRLAETTVDLALQVTEADSCWLALRDEESGAWRLAAARHLFPDELAEGVPPVVTRWAIEQLQPKLVNFVGKSSLNVAMSVWKRDVQSLIAVPLKSGDVAVGCLYVGRKLEYGFEQDDLDMLVAFSEQVVIALKNAKLVESSLIKERLEQELRIAHNAQMKLLPKAMPQLPGVAVEAVCMTANEVGGDYYDFFPIDESHMGLVIADVSGKGASAAFIMAELKGIMEALAPKHRSPKELLISANETLYSNVDRNIFVSLVYGIIDTRAKTLCFCRAGQCPILQAHSAAETINVLEPKGMGLGLDNGPSFAQATEEVCLPYQPGDTFLFFTDGAIEARNSRGEEFTEIRLASLFQRYYSVSPAELKERLIAEIDDFVGPAKSHDDLTFLILKAV